MVGDVGLATSDVVDPLLDDCVVDEFGVVLVAAGVEVLDPLFGQSML